MATKGNITTLFGARLHDQADTGTTEAFTRLRSVTHLPQVLSGQHQSQMPLVGNCVLQDGHVRPTVGTSRRLGSENQPSSAE